MHTDDLMRAFSIGDRIADSLEKLAAEPVIDVPVKPPVCPHCGRMNPFIRAHESEATGALFEFVMQCHCLSCNKVFYMIPEGYNCIAEIEDVQSLMDERAELAGYDNSSRQDS